MSNNNKSKNNNQIAISEINSNSQKANFTLESSSTKSYDVTKMTGKPSNTDNDSEE